MTNIDEKNIILGLSRGEEKAFRYLFKVYYPLMCHLAATMLHDDFTAETVVSDVISHLYEVREELNIHTSLRSFLFTSVRNACLNYVGTKKYRTELPISTLSTTNDTLPDQRTTAAHPLGQLLEREMENEIQTAIDALPDTTKRVFCKSRFDGKKYQEIAEEEELSINAIKYHMKRSLAILHEKLEKVL